MSLEALADAVESEHCRDLIRHWNETRGNRLMPGWSQIRPAAMKRALPYVWSWKFDRQSDIFTGRFAGAEVLEIFGGKSFSGVTMSGMYPHGFYEFVHVRFRRVVMTPEFLRGHGMPFHRFDQYYLGERIIMPLAEDGLHGDGIIGVTDYRASLGIPSDDVIRTGELEDWYSLA
jgi:PAS domain